jgi:hypothetical protein
MHRVAERRFSAGVRFLRSAAKALFGNAAFNME